MISISQTFEKCRDSKSKALMPYLTCGFPDEKTFLELYRTISSAGADMIEVGIPFSDPLADGKSIQYSSQKALECGLTVAHVLELVNKLSVNGCPAPILMTYFNPIYAFGLTRFARLAKEVGVKGLIVPDIIVEEGGELEKLCTKQDIDLIYLLAPTSDLKRKQQIVRRSRGFVYLVSVTGVTGARQKLPLQLNRLIRQTKKLSRLPVCVGFGIRNQRQARNIARYADGVIIGSAIVDIIRNSSSRKKSIYDVGKYIENIRKGLNNVQA